MERSVTAGGAKVPDFPPPTGREILLRTCVPRPAPYSKALPQRLFCVMLGEEFRLAGAFSSDTSFFWVASTESFQTVCCRLIHTSVFCTAPKSWSAFVLDVHTISFKDTKTFCFKGDPNPSDRLGRRQICSNIMEKTQLIRFLFRQILSFLRFSCCTCGRKENARSRVTFLRHHICYPLFSK